jgi:hypothetical protein
VLEDHKEIMVVEVLGVMQRLEVEAEVGPDHLLQEDQVVLVQRVESAYQIQFQVHL